MLPLRRQTKRLTPRRGLAPWAGLAAPHFEQRLALGWRTFEAVRGALHDNPDAHKNGVRYAGNNGWQGPSLMIGDVEHSADMDSRVLPVQGIAKIFLRCMR